MTVEQLMESLKTMPKDAVVILETDGGLARVAGLTFEKNSDGMPDEVILFTDAEE
jgi:hypothetical protein